MMRDSLNTFWNCFCTVWIMAWHAQPCWHWQTVGCTRMHMSVSHLY